MWINPSNETVYASEQAVRAAFPGTSFSESITDDQAASVGLLPFLLSSKPSYNPITQSVAQIAPVLINGAWTQQWSVTAISAPLAQANLAASKLAQIAKIDADVDYIYQQVIGNRAQEYAQAEAEAKSYIQAGYTGTVPDFVQAWATAKGWTATQAADDIAATALAWRTAAKAMRANRLLSKEQARSAATEAQFSTAVAQWAGFFAAIKTQLGVL